MVHVHHLPHLAATAAALTRHPAIASRTAPVAAAVSSAGRVIYRASGELPRRLERIVARAVRAKEKRDEAEERYRAELRDALEEAHEAGLPDHVLADALGVSRQRVYQLRLGRYR